MAAVTFKTADEVVEHLTADGFVKTGYDPLFPWEKTYENGHIMRARGGYDHNREQYYIEGLRC